MRQNYKKKQKSIFTGKGGEMIEEGATKLPKIVIHREITEIRGVDLEPHLEAKTLSPQ